MLSGACYFRGNFMTVAGATSLLKQLCKRPELTPEFWNYYEPIDNQFRCDKLDEVVWGAMVPSPKAQKHFVRTLTFFLRKSKPQCSISIDLCLAPVQGQTPHNCIQIDDTEEPWPQGPQILAEYLPHSAPPKFPDYAKIVESSLEDPDRLSEFKRPMTGRQVNEMLAKRTVSAPMGPGGAIEDIYWFNYFGRVYVEFIGESRLLASGWERVERVGDGLACYATDSIDDPHFPERRRRIAGALDEFVWTPDCDPRDKRVPHFDFSEQRAALLPEVRAQIPDY